MATQAVTIDSKGQPIEVGTRVFDKRRWRQGDVSAISRPDEWGVVNISTSTGPDRTRTNHLATKVKKGPFRCPDLEVIPND